MSITQASSQAAIARTNTIALDFGWAVFGRAGGVLYALVVAVSCLGVLTGAPFIMYLPPTSFPQLASLAPLPWQHSDDALLGSLFTSSRVVYAAARTGQLPRAFGVLDANRGTPIRAVALQAALSIVLIFLGGGFRSLFRIAVVALWGFYCLTVCPSFKTFPTPAVMCVGFVLNLYIGFSRCGTPCAGAGPSSVCLGRITLCACS